MAIAWSVMRDQIRRSILKDETNLRATNETLLDACGWALAQFADHTAVQVEQIFADGVGGVDMSTDTAFTVTLEPFDSLLTAAAVSLVGDYETPLEPMDQLHGATSGYTVWPNDTINLAEPPGANYSLRVRYFSYYTVPVVDTDVVAIPEWAHGALMYLIGSHVLVQIGVQMADLSQWEERGNKEWNSLRAQQRWMYEMYERMIQYRPRQNRSLATLEDY